MGLREIHGLKGPDADGTDSGALAVARLIHRAVSDSNERARRRDAQERVDLYYEFTRHVLINAAAQVFKTVDVRKKMEPFLELAGATNLFRRTIDEVAGPIYQVAPTRKVLLADGREPDKVSTQKYRELAKAVCLDERNDLACHLGTACNSVWLLGRKPKALEHPVLDVLTPAQVTILSHPDDAHRDVGLIYDRTYVKPDGQSEKVNVCWDDKEMFIVSKGGALLAVEPHEIGRVPWVSIHMTERPAGVALDSTSGNALAKAAIAAALLTALTLKLHKSSGFKQVVVTGDIVNFPKEQIFDEENALLAPSGTTISTLDLDTSGDHYLGTLENIVRAAAAQYGISLDRLNAKAAGDSSDLGLEERRADAIKVFRRAEEDMFDLLCKMQRGTVAAGARLKVDFGELSLRTDPMGTLDLWTKMEERGVRNVLDDIRALNPEIDSDEEAWAEFERNLDVRAKKVEKMRALNMSKDASPNMPGQDAQANGALGPKVRAGQMTRDEADAEAQGATPDADE